MTDALGGTSSQAATPAAAGTDMMQSVMPMMSIATQAPQMFAQAPQAFSSLPQMLSQGFGQMGGLLGPLTDAGSLGGAASAEVAPIAALPAESPQRGPARASTRSAASAIGGPTMRR